MPLIRDRFRLACFNGRATVTIYGGGGSVDATAKLSMFDVLRKPQPVPSMDWIGLGKRIFRKLDGLDGIE